ncbi:MAG: NYN domain-containing protein [Lachnospiraceae bacterium]|jgi:predicted nuclease of predicted toxin-antitoxin system|nr:NYN domain-containing protein [Lachnospiraceae bacterium]MCI1327721.1 NYN domain-containing protein [Lachnospiraceae bacterium]
MDNELRFAVLIDADNISDKYIKIILDETASNGIATYKRIYGDWTSQRMASWKSVLLDNSVIPMQQYSYTTGKNATDSAMIIDAMDILYSGTVDGFCLVSSDSDFTRLAARIREAGKQVIGMGESKTPPAFISACNQFKYLDLLYEQRQQEAALEEEEDAADAAEDAEADRTPSGGSGAKSGGEQPQKCRNSDHKKKGRQKELRKIKRTINSIIEQFSDEDDWIFSGKLGDQLSKRLPDFDVRNYGYSKFTPFIRSLGDYEIRKISEGNGQQQIYIRLKTTGKR